MARDAVGNRKALSSRIMSPVSALCPEYPEYPVYPQFAEPSPAGPGVASNQKPVISGGGAGKRLTVRGRGVARTAGKTMNAMNTGKSAHYMSWREITGFAALRSRAAASVPARL